MEVAVAQSRAPLHSGCEESLVEALAESAPRHMAIAVRMLDDREEAREILQEAWIRAWRNRGSIRESAALQGWLRRIVVHECLRALRWKAARSWLTFSWRVPEATDPSPSPDGLIGKARLVAEVRRLAAALPPRQRLVWGLRFDEGWSVREIAESADMTVDTVRTHLGRALMRIQEQMGRRHAV
ncbi:MAG: RNA polymerase sigma factor [Deltaproteobacteria bacterium]|nr:RNA polymerase sigma factor [Deltaproteobacteria bacterium]